MLEMSNY